MWLQVESKPPLQMMSCSQCKLYSAWSEWTSIIIVIIIIIILIFFVAICAIFLHLLFIIVEVIMLLFIHSMLSLSLPILLLGFLLLSNPTCKLVCLGKSLLFYQSSQNVKLLRIVARVLSGIKKINDKIVIEFWAPLSFSSTDCQPANPFINHNGPASPTVVPSACQLIVRCQ